MNPTLDEIYSIINGFPLADDKDRVFTYIEFIKMFGYNNDTNIFITYYKEYVTRWAQTKQSEITVTDDEFVFAKLVDILKSVTLDYSSYEEQDFIAHINLYNKAHLKALSALYSRKIREITEFYRKKRNESVLVVNRNSIKGSTKSIQEIIYNKVFDFIFSNRNIVPSYKNIKRDLLVTVEQYVDTYSEYFDIPRNYEFTDETRREMLTANMNDVDYRMYLEIELVVSELLFSGNVMLEEIPLIAQLGIDLSQNCVGDMLALKNSLVANTTINQVDLNEQIALKRKLYEKFLGCDLWYMYVDLQGNVQMDVLCKAQNPTGNLLNCGSPDTATIPSGQEELLTHIGLFFKPDKTSILKVNAKDYTWTIDTDNLIEDTVYIFPDPDKYGDIGNNKDGNYPLIMEYHLDWDIRNLSSGTSVDDPLMFITDQGWKSYYSKQDDDFKLCKNINYEYSFTYFANKGFLSDYQKDIWGNEFGILKGSDLTYIDKIIIDENGNEITVQVPKLTLKGNSYTKEMIYGYNEQHTSTPVLLNGGYFENPFYPGHEIRKDNGDLAWVYQGSELKCQPFNFKQRLIVNSNYKWSGITTYGTNIHKEQIEFSPSLYDNQLINFGNFGDNIDVIYEDHFMKVPSNYSDVIDNENIISNVLQQFFSVNLLENPEASDFEFEVEDITYEEMKKLDGDVYIKLVGSPQIKPYKLEELFNWLKDETKPWKLSNFKFKSFANYHDNLILENDDEILFIPYSYDGITMTDNLGTREALRLSKYKNVFDNETETFNRVDLPTKMLFVEQDKAFYVLQFEEWRYNGMRTLTLPYVYKFDPINYTLKQIINVFDSSYKEKYENAKLDAVYRLFSDYMVKKNTIIGNGSLLQDNLNNGLYQNFLDFEIPQYDDNGLGEIGFSFNSALGTYLISYVLMDKNGTPYIYEHKFKMTSLDDFESSMKTNVYTLKALESDTDVYWVSNSSLDGGAEKCYPYDALDDKKIFTT